ncbi:uncharacterized protein MKK02DRAFT_42349 [Dioszegia hungarica]|uniref:Uncharacterized protein n=1 Tax=Dioszegia hungarica TaxID=4972 RepID=A0AA38HD26_9TREE|nr:uncharacterized protein MKK02DRAFT_42349 [Dioszegia hungarica]KAI9637968.1 hypothetical protein MKK02DRAFT_42349 [Dioszegia hungarica]
MSRPGKSNRRPSFPSSAAPAVLNNIDQPASALSKGVVPSIAFVKHGKYIALGSAGLWYTGLIPHARGILESNMAKGWAGRLLMLAIGLHGTTVAIFLYLVVFLPWLRGYIPNYPLWQQSARLRIIVPLLTSTILLGWTSFVISLTQAGDRSVLGALGDAVKAVGEGDSARLRAESGMGVWRAMAGSTALYVLTLGVLGFIPMPTNVSVGKKKD